MTRFILTPIAAFLLLLAAGIAHAATPGTAFTYQGRLNAGGNPANGSYDLRFILYNADSGGSQVGSTLTHSAMSVDNGTFTSELDFGTVFDGNPYWLEISVRTNTGGAFVPLNPRQPLTPTPYAITAGKMSGPLPAAQLSGQLSGAQIADGAVDAAKIDNTQVQLRITGTAPAGQFITGIAANGSVTVGPDTTDWKLSGNNLAGGQFLGSTNNQPVELRVNNARALVLDRSGGQLNIAVGSTPNAIAGGVGGAGILSGFNNLIRSNSSSSVISGGQNNTVTNALDSVIGGGSANWVQGFAATVSGGAGNQSRQDRATVAGGSDNLAAADSSFVGGGIGNAANNGAASIVGGFQNVAYGAYASIGGGISNSIPVPVNYVVIGGGSGNSVVSGSATVSGGAANLIQSGSDYSVISGGQNNLIQSAAYGATIAGGQLNAILSSTHNSTISGGTNNTIGGSAHYSTIAGGGGNRMEDFASISSIGGGYLNSIQFNAFDSVIGGGLNNTIRTNAGYGVIGGGANNVIQVPAYGSVIGGGNLNTNNGVYAVIPGGDQNVVADNSFAAGHRAKANHTGTFVWADNTDTDFNSTTNKQFAVRANNGLMIQATNVALDLRGGGALKVAGAGIGASTPVFIHRAVAANTAGNNTTIDHPLCNNDGSAILLVTQNWNPGGGSGTYNGHPVGVFYTGSRWAIFNEDMGVMPTNATFNVLVFKP